MSGITGCFDAECPKCNHSIGWQGAVTDWPACPKCGHKPSAEELAGDYESLWQFHVHLNKDARFESGPSLKRAREYCGLRNVTVAARLLEIPVELLQSIEDGKQPVDAKLAVRMNRVYGMKR